ncbi:major facilitator superfamily domain-containing protein [Aspergillus desertorum]
MEPLQLGPEPSTPRLLLLKLISSGFSFFVAGLNDGSLGALIPYIRQGYDVDTNMVSIVYGTTFFGWFFAALTNSYLGQYFNIGILLLFGAALQILAHALRIWAPPFPVFTVTFFIAALGQAYQDTHANNFVATVKGAHRWLGFIHAMYMGGCLVGPFVSTAVASSGRTSHWELFYTTPLGMGVVNLVLVWVAFREWATMRQNEPGAVIRGSSVAPTGGYDRDKKDSRHAGSWIVEYLVDVRNGDLDKMGYVPAGFYGGSFIGRLLLAEPTHRFGERRMILVYVVLCLALELVFWLYEPGDPETMNELQTLANWPRVPNIITEAVAISLLGLFSGPFFATGISVASKLFAEEIRSSALAFIFLVGQIGGAIFPAVTGVIAAQSGVKVLQPMLVGLLGATGVSWLIIPKPRLHHD